MKLNRFTQKGLVKEFPWLLKFIEGQGLTALSCSKCGHEYGNFQGESPSVPGHDHCPGCGTYNFMTTSRVIHPYIPAHARIEEVVVRKVDETFLRSVPETYSWDGSVVSINRGSSIQFITRQDHELSSGPIYGFSDPVQGSGTSGSNYAHSETSEWDGESVAHAIDRLGLRPEQIVAVLEHQYGIRTIEHYSEGQRLVIWKAGKADQTIKAVIDRLYSEAADQVAAEADL